MAVDLIAFSRRVAFISGLLGVGLFGIQPAMAELAISRLGWGGENLAKVALTGANARQQLLVTESLGDGSVVDQTRRAALRAVSYTHLTLPTICSV